MDYTAIIITLLSGGVGLSIVNAVIEAIKDAKWQHSKELSEIKESVAVLRTATQASLRNELRKKYKTCKKQGYTTFEDRDDFDFIFNQYHALGANGVMTDCYNKFMALEIKEEDE